MTLPHHLGHSVGQVSQPFASLTDPLLNHFITCVHFHNRRKGTEKAHSKLIILLWLESLEKKNEKVK